MPVLAALKRTEARRTNNVALSADAVQSATCAYLALATLAGLVANAAFHIPWVDSLAALFAIPILLYEGRAAWRGEESATEDEELSVETQLFGCLMTESGAMIRISTAWASHQDSDTTGIVVYGQGGELALQCTFGFSADATAAQSLTLLKNAQRQQLPFQVEEKLAPYRTFVASAMELLGESNPATGPRGRLEQQKLRSLGSAMEVLYGGRTVAHGTQECSPCLSA